MNTLIWCSIIFSLIKINEKIYLWYHFTTKYMAKNTKWGFKPNYLDIVHVDIVTTHAQLCIYCLLYIQWNLINFKTCLQ